MGTIEKKKQETIDELVEELVKVNKTKGDRIKKKL